MLPNDSMPTTRKSYPKGRKFPRPLVDRTCQNCGKPFQTSPSQIDKRGGKYCSRECQGLARTAQFAATLAERFWVRVDRTEGCWFWRGPLDANGYGKHGSKWAHRIAYELAIGPIAAGMQVCHTCDNRQCVAPAHLFLGTALDNTLDKKRKGRSNMGVKHGMSKLTDESIEEIRRRYANNEATQAELATEFGVSRSCISFVVTRRAWRHIPDE